jgi:hypothetical protein
MRGTKGIPDAVSRKSIGRGTTSKRRDHTPWAQLDATVEACKYRKGDLSKKKAACLRYFHLYLVEVWWYHYFVPVVVDFPVPIVSSRIEHHCKCKWRQLVVSLEVPRIDANSVDSPTNCAFDAPFVSAHEFPTCSIKESSP